MADTEAVSMIVKMLVKDRQQEMDGRHYRAMILANASAKDGSVSKVEALLHEMEEKSVPVDSDILHAALKVEDLPPVIMYT